MSSPEAQAHVAGTLASALASVGLTNAVICPGSRNTPLVLALAATQGVRIHTVLDERAAAFLALGMARADGRAAVVCCTSGSAPAHMLPAVIEAAHSRVPLIVLSADRPRDLQHCGAPQTIDQLRLFGEHVRWFADLGTPVPGQGGRWIAALAGQAWLRAHGLESGPVHLNVPFSEPLWSPDLTAASSTRHRAACRIVRGDLRIPQAEVQSLAQRLRAVDRGVIVCGPWDPAAHGGAGSDAPAAFAAAVNALAQALNWPLLAEPASQVRFRADRAAQLINFADVLLRVPAVAERMRPDLVLRFGRAPTSNPTNQWLASTADQRTIVVDGARLFEDPHHCMHELVVVDPTLICRDLLQHLSQQIEPSAANKAWLAKWKQAEEIAAPVVDHALGEGLWEGSLARKVVQLLPDGAWLHVGSSMPIRDVDAFAGGLARDVVVLANRGANGIDGTLATAGGEALAAGTGRRVVLLTGDLALLHDMGGLAAIAQLSLDLTVVVVNNGGGGIFEFLPIAAHATAFKPHFLTPQTTRIDKLCEAVGASHSRATNLAELHGLLERALTRPGLSVVEAIVDRADNVARHRKAFRTVDWTLTTWLRASVKRITERIT